MVGKISSDSVLRILLVDDNEDILFISKTYLEHISSFIVDIALSVPEGYDLLQVQQYDAIVSDYDMPDINGISFLMMIRKNGYTIPFIIFSSKDKDEIETETVSMDSYHYLQKGYDPERMFTDLIQQVLHVVDLHNVHLNNLCWSE